MPSKSPLPSLSAMDSANLTARSKGVSVTIGGVTEGCGVGDALTTGGALGSPEGVPEGAVLITGLLFVVLGVSVEPAVSDSVSVVVPEVVEPVVSVDVGMTEG